MVQAGLKVEGQKVMEGNSPWKQDYAKRCLQEELQFNQMRLSMMAQHKLRMENIVQAILIEKCSPFSSNEKLFDLNVQLALEADELKRVEESTYKKSLALRIEGWLGKQFNR